MATESELRYNVAHFLDAYKGCAEGSTKHRYLVDMFNNSGKCTRYKVKYTDAWCAVAFCDCFIGTGLTDLIPIDCGCSEMVKKSKEMGIWVENDAYVPEIGDGIEYDWQDTTGSKSDNTGDPDHIGIVQSVNKSAGTFTVIEGNKSNTVGVRSMTINGSYIRGFITPDYASAASGDSGTTSGSTGKPYAESGPDDSIAGTYTVTADELNVRMGAGTDCEVLTTIPYGTPVYNYGYYSTVDGVKWLYVQLIDGTVGFCSSKYLSKGTSTGTTTSSLPSYSTGSTYTVQVDHLAVRTGAGTSYSKKSRSQLTSNGQANAYSDGCLKKGTKVTCQATKTVNGDVWMQIPSGWIAAYYDCEKYVK